MGDAKSAPASEHSRSHSPSRSSSHSHQPAPMTGVTLTGASDGGGGGGGSGGSRKFRPPKPVLVVCANCGAVAPPAVLKNDMNFCSGDCYWSYSFRDMTYDEVEGMGSKLSIPPPPLQRPNRHTHTDSIIMESGAGGGLGGGLGRSPAIPVPQKSSQTPQQMARNVSIEPDELPAGQSVRGSIPASPPAIGSVVVATPPPPAQPKSPQRKSGGAAVNTTPPTQPAQPSGSMQQPQPRYAAAIPLPRSSSGSSGGSGGAGSIPSPHTSPLKPAQSPQLRPAPPAPTATPQSPAAAPRRSPQLVFSTAVSFSRPVGYVSPLHKPVTVATSASALPALQLAAPVITNPPAGVGSSDTATKPSPQTNSRDLTNPSPKANPVAPQSPLQPRGSSTGPLLPSVVHRDDIKTNRPKLRVGGGGGGVGAPASVAAPPPATGSTAVTTSVGATATGAAILSTSPNRFNFRLSGSPPTKTGVSPRTTAGANTLPALYSTPTGAVVMSSSPRNSAGAFGTSPTRALHYPQPLRPAASASGIVTTTAVGTMNSASAAGAATGSVRYSSPFTATGAPTAFLPPLNEQSSLQPQSGTTAKMDIDGLEAAVADATDSPSGTLTVPAVVSAFGSTVLLHQSSGSGGDVPMPQSTGTILSTLVGANSKSSTPRPPSAASNGSGGSGTGGTTAAAGAGGSPNRLPHSPHGPATAPSSRRGTTTTQTGSSAAGGGGGGGAVGGSTVRISRTNRTVSG